MAAAPLAQTPDVKQIEAGKLIYEKLKCRTCHSIAGVGSKMSPLDGVGSKLKPEEIREWIVNPGPLTAKLKTKPKVAMKPYKLSEDDLSALVAFMSSLVKK
jgi:mono/diheme cytochrome c family protein